MHPDNWFGGWECGEGSVSYEDDGSRLYQSTGTRHPLVNLCLCIYINICIYIQIYCITLKVSHTLGERHTWPKNFTFKKTLLINFIGSVTFIKMCQLKKLNFTGNTVPIKSDGFMPRLGA